MAIELTVANEQSDEPIDEAYWSTFTEQVITTINLGPNIECSLRFVDEPTITHLNEDYLAHVGPTDVLSFPIEDPLSFSDSARLQENSAPLLLGDIVICPRVAALRAPEHDHSVEDELALLVVHGILHLIGMDHEKDDEAEVMEARERELLGALRGSGR